MGLYYGFSHVSSRLGRNEKITDGNAIRGFVQCEAARAVDLGVREAEGAAEVVGALDDETLAQVMAVVLVVLGLQEF